LTFSDDGDVSQANFITLCFILSLDQVLAEDYLLRFLEELELLQLGDLLDAVLVDAGQDELLDVLVLDELQLVWDSACGDESVEVLIRKPGSEDKLDEHCCQRPHVAFLACSFGIRILLEQWKSLGASRGFTSWTRLDLLVRPRQVKSPILK